MDKKAIETLAVSTIRDSVVLSDRLDQYIQENDKEPSVDGFVNLYLPGGKTKGNFYGRVAVQVKGTNKKILQKNNNIKFPVEITDLHFYLKEGGVLFFVVSISPDGKRRRVFYNELLPVKIYKILSLSQGKSTKNLRFRELTDISNIERVFFAFYNEKQKQPPALVDLPQLTSIDELQKQNVLSGISFSVPNAQKYHDSIEAILNCDVYMYAQIKGSMVSLPVDIIDEESDKTISYKSDNTISAGNISYDGYEVIRKRGETNLNIADWLFINISDCESGTMGKTTLSFKPRKMIKDRAKDYEFLIEFLETGGLYNNGKFCDFKVNPTMINESTFNIDKCREHLIFFQKTIKLFEKLHIDQDLDIQYLNDKDFLELNVLISAFIDKKPINNLKKDLPFNYYVKIGDVIIALFHHKESDSEYIGDIFSETLSFGFDADGKKHFVPTYSMLDKEGWIRISNIDFKAVLPAFQKFYANHNDSIIFSVANNSLLSMLLAYDNSKKSELLEAAINISKWLLDNSLPDVIDESICSINYFQAIARKRNFDKSELLKLSNIAEDSSIENQIRVGAYLLLNNKLAAESHFNRLDEDTQKSFVNWPIYHFWKNNESVERSL